MRPKYETPQDKKNENNIVPLIEEHFGFRLKSCPEFYGSDFMLLDDDKNCKGFIEYKRRHMHFGKYPDVMLSSKKIVKALEFFPLDTYFLVEWDDAMGYVVLHNGYFRHMKWGGRTAQTRDQFDIELVAHIPNSDFHLINKETT